MTSPDFDTRVPGGKLPNTPIWGADTRRLPADAPKELVAAYQVIERACLEIERAAAVLQILRFQRGQIIKDINENNLSGAFWTLNTSMTRDLVTSISALFDKDCRSTHITEAAGALVRPEHDRFIFSGSEHVEETINVYRKRKQKLIEAIQKAKNPKYRSSLARILKARKQRVAHFSVNPKEFSAIYRDIEILIVISTKIVKFGCLYVEGKQIPLDGLLKKSIADARMLMKIIHRGANNKE